MTEVYNIKPYRNRRIFLGGTCPNTPADFNYRHDLSEIFDLYDKLEFDFFNPVVSNWDEKAREREEEAKLDADIHLYVISPNMRGVYSIAESFGSLIKYKNKRVIFIVIKEVPEYNIKFDEFQLKSLSATGKLLSECGGEYYSLDTYYHFKQDILNILIED
jgi:hypothetical protein